jgi:hypothetical protein
MTTLVEVPTKDSKGAPATKLVQILSDTTVTDNENNTAGQVVYSFSKGMREIIKDSTLWGRVRNAVIFAFTSKYALALYELITARINLKHMWQEEFSLADLRALLGVPDGKLERVPNLLQRAIQPAPLEVNGLADFGVKIEPMRKGGSMRGLVTGFACHGGARRHLIYKPPSLYFSLLAGNYPEMGSQLTACSATQSATQKPADFAFKFREPARFSVLVRRFVSGLIFIYSIAVHAALRG